MHMIQKHPYVAIIIVIIVVFILGIFIKPITVLTAVLVIITAWYAYHTYKIANIMSLDYELKINPLIIFDKGGGSIENGKFTFRSNIDNKGEYVCFLKNIQLNLYLVNDPNKHHLKDILIKETEIIPKSKPLFINLSFNRNETNVDEIKSQDNKFGTHIKADLLLEYAGPDKKFKKREYKLW